MNKFIKIVFNDDVEQKRVDNFSEIISWILNYEELTAIQIVGEEEECDDAALG